MSDSHSSASKSSFIRSLKNSKSERELEEGETISPSPSPQRRSSRRERSRSRHRSSRNRSESRHRRSSSYRHYRSRSRSPRKKNRRRNSSRDRSSDKRRRSNRSPRTSNKKKRRDDGDSDEERKPPSRTTKHRSPSRDKYRSESRDQSVSKHRSISRDAPKTESPQDIMVVKSPPLKSNNQSVIASEEPIVAVVTDETGLSATASNSDTPEQYKLFNIMFAKLARAHKKRGDSQKDVTFGMIDHFHALCDYMLHFYYMDMTNTSTKMTLKEASGAWKTLFPFADNLLAKLQTHKLYFLYGLCARLVSLVRFYIFDRMVHSVSKTVLTTAVADRPKEASAVLDISVGLFKESEKAERWYKTSEEYFSYVLLMEEFPETHAKVCLRGDVSVGISLGGEAGTSVKPMFPFGAHSPLHHAAIVSKCVLHEYITKQHLDYTPIQRPEEYMD